MTSKLRKYGGHLHALSVSSPRMCKAIIKNADPGLVKCLCECALNVIKGNVPITPDQKRRLARYKTDLRNLAKSKTPAKTKKKILQKGGVLPLALILAKASLPVIASGAGSLIKCVLFKKKEKKFPLRMEHTKKMVLVDPKILHGGMFPAQAVDPTAVREPEVGVIDKTLKGLDEGLHAIVNTPDVPEDEKVKLYSNYLQDYLVLQKKKSGIYAKPPPVAIISPQMQPQAAPLPQETVARIEEEVIETLPQKLKKQVVLLMEHIKRDPEMSWNPRGEILVRGQRDPDSNVVDLVKDLLQKRKGVNPAGWKTFASHLAESNIPQDLVRNPDRLRFMKNKENYYSPSDDLTPEMVQESISQLESEEDPTPKSRKGRKRKKSQTADLVLNTQPHAKKNHGCH